MRHLVARSGARLEIRLAALLMKNFLSPRWSGLIVLCALPFVTACGDDEAPANEPRAFALEFSAKAGDQPVNCKTDVAGLGPDGAHTVGLSDLRFYVSNLVFEDARGNALSLTLDQNDFQYTSEAGSVALIDLTGNTQGSCAGNAIAFAEGTARTNGVVTGSTLVDEVAKVSFEVGVPQALMGEVIANHSAEGAPSPLNEMQWTWASGYRHFVMNFTIADQSGEAGEGYLHVGSRDCGPQDGLALADREECGFVNTAKVALENFHLERQRVTVDLQKILAGLDFASPIYDPETFEVLGEGPGVECHSSPMQSDCATLFANLGLDLEDGSADASRDDAFSSE